MATSTTSKNVEQFNMEAKILEKMAVHAGKLGVSFDKHLKSLGSSVKDLTKMEKIQLRIKNITSDISSLDEELLNLLERRAKTEVSSYQTNLKKKLVEEQAALLVANTTGDLQKQLSITEKIKDINYEIYDAGTKGKRDLSDKIKATSKLVEEQRRGLKVENAKMTVAELEKKLLEYIVKLTVDFYRKTYDTFKSIDGEMASIRTHTGLFRDDSKELETIAQSLNEEYMGVGATIEISSNTVKAVRDNFKGISSATKETYDNITLMSAQLGISEKTSADVLNNFAGISGKLVKDISDGMTGFAAELSKASGTNFKDVMSDIAGASDTVRANFRGSSVELIKATVEARRMGLSIESVAKTSDSLLDFNSSVNAEMEASVLLGKNINLNAARRAAWNGDLLGQNIEILKVVKSAGDFEKMNAMQRKSLATAVGKSVEDLQKMLTIDKEIAWVEAQGTPVQRKLLEDQRAMLKLSESEGKNLGENFEKSAKLAANQARMVILTQKWNELLFTVGKPIMELMGKLADIALKWIPPITEFFKKFPGMIYLIVGAFSLVSLLSGTAILITGWKALIALRSVWNNMGGFDGLGKIGRGKIPKPNPLPRQRIPKGQPGAGRWLPSGSTPTPSAATPSIWARIVIAAKTAWSTIKTFGTSTWSLIRTFAGSTWTMLLRLGPFLNTIWTSISGAFSTVLGWLTSAAAGILLLKALIIAAVAYIGYKIGGFIYEYFTEPLDDIAEYWLNAWDKISEDLVGGLKSVGVEITSALAYPFEAAWETVKGWIGQSPSELGLGIVDGIISVGTTIVDALISPFKSAYTFVTELFDKIPAFIIDVFKRGFDFVTKLPGMGFLTKAVDAFSGNKAVEVNREVGTTQTKQDDTNLLILEKLTELTELMKSGGIAINMDGRRVSEALAHVSS